MTAEEKLLIFWILPELMPVTEVLEANLSSPGSRVRCAGQSMSLYQPLLTIFSELISLPDEREEVVFASLEASGNLNALSKVQYDIISCTYVFFVK